MYVGSSYNDTISGDTLSSLSEKSDSYFTSDLENCQRKNFVVSIFNENIQTLYYNIWLSRKRNYTKDIIIGKD